MTSECLQCGKALVGRRNKKFCDAQCSREWHSTHWHENNPKTAASQLATGTIGSVNLMRVMLDLVQRGYHVYRAAFEAMPFELMVWATEGTPRYGQGALRVKVTTGHRNAAGAVTHRKLDPVDYGYDVLAVVVVDEIHYEGANL